MDNFLGIEIGGTKLQFVVGDNPENVLLRRHFDVDKEQGASGIRRQIESVLSELLPVTQPEAIGVGFGGPVDWRRGNICHSHHIEGWTDFALSEWLNLLAGVPVFVENDANVAALAEATHGAVKGFNPIFYVTLGSGVGGGLVVDERIYHGLPPGESEIGHLRLDRQGTIVESRCSGWAVDAKIRRLRSTQPSSLLYQLIGDQSGCEARFLAPAFAKGDALAKQILRETAEDLAFALSHVIHLFHPQVIVIGGGLSLVGEPLRASVESALRPFVMEAFSPGPQIRLAALGQEAVPMGALELARFCSRSVETL